jgi:hypothetical protein
MQENLLHLGLCLPKSCNNSQIRFLVQKLFDSSETESLKVHARVGEVKEPKFNLRIFQESGFWIFVVFIAATKLLNHSATKLEKEMKVDENNNIAAGTENRAKLPMRKKLVKCFNLEANKKALTSREISSSTVASISGLR